MPIYKAKITLTEGDEQHQTERLVEAKNEAAARKHITNDTIEISLAEGKDIHRLGQDNVGIEQAE